MIFPTSRLVGYAIRSRGRVLIGMILQPIGSMYGIFTYIYQRNQPNVGK